MRNRRFAQVTTSDDEDDDVAPRSHQQSAGDTSSRKRKQVKLREGDDEESGEEEKQKSKKKRRGKEKEAETASGSEDEEEEPHVVEDAKPIGEVVKLSGKGRGRRQHYKAFEYDGTRFDLEDPVLLTPEDTRQKPYVAIIKDISRTGGGSMMVLGQWFYRPEEAEKKAGGNWQSTDTRELFYSFHRDEVPAESVMHKCLVHFVPLNKQLPSRKQHPGFIVQKVYDTQGKKLWKLTDRDYEEDKQHEIDLLVQKTIKLLGELPDIEIADNNAYQDDQLKSKRGLVKKNISPLDVSRVEEATARPGHNQKTETPGSCPTSNSEYHSILAKSMALTGDTLRDRWLEKLLQNIRHHVWNSADTTNGIEKRKSGSDDIDHESDCKSTEVGNGSQDNLKSGNTSFLWPEDAVRAVTSLEKTSHESLSSDFQKYNQKLRQLGFNLQKNSFLARRLLNRELEPLTIVNMSPEELKEGLTAEERAKKEPDDWERMQMTDARCSRCSEFKVGVRDIIQAGNSARYQVRRKYQKEKMSLVVSYQWHSPTVRQIPQRENAPKQSTAMGRRGGGGAKRVPNTAFASTNNISLREELTGKKQTKGGSSINAKAALKLEHLQRLAVWTRSEASVPSLGAFFGRTLAAAQEAIVVPPKPSLFPCQRCETVLQPGFNCTVRIEKNRAKAQRRSKKLINFSQNNVVYTCHFCSHRNLKRGTPNGHMKTICPPKAKTTLKLNLARSIPKKFVNSKKTTAGDEVSKADEIASSTGGEIPTVDTPAGEDEVSKANEVAPSAGTEIPSVDTPATPAVKTGITLLLGGKKRRRNNSATKKLAEPESSPTSIAENTTSTSNKRRRKSWTSLKEIAKRSDHSNMRKISLV